MSHGCRRCCTYGSVEQQRAAAERIARAIDLAPELLAALEKLIAAAPAYRGVPMGVITNRAQALLDAHIAAEDDAIAVITKAKGGA